MAPDHGLPDGSPFRSDGAKYRAESLGGGFFCACDNEHPLTTDPFLLAAFADASGVERAADLGCGNGIIALLWARENKNIRVTAADIDPGAVKLARISTALSGCADRVTVAQADLRQPSALPQTSFELAAANPPFFRDGKTAQSDSRAGARHEINCTLPEICAAARRCLAPGGRFCVCVRPESESYLLGAFTGAGFMPARLRLCADSPDKKPFLLLAEGVLRPAKLQTLPPFFARNADGTLTEEYKKLYGGFYG